MTLLKIGILFIFTFYITAFHAMLSPQEIKIQQLQNAQLKLKKTDQEFAAIRTIRTTEIKKVIKEEATSSLTERYSATLLNDNSASVFRYVWSFINSSTPHYEYDCTRTVQIPDSQESVTFAISDDNFSILKEFYEKNNNK